MLYNAPTHFIEYISIASLKKKNNNLDIDYNRAIGNLS